jgi:uncharacterized protein
MKFRIIIAMVVIASFCCSQTPTPKSTAAPAASSSSSVGSSVGKTAKIEQLLEETGSLKIGAMIGKALVSQLYQSFQSAGAPVNDSVLKIMESEVNLLMDQEMRLKSGLVDQMVALYDKYYTEKDIDEILKFYRSETGKKVISTLPQLTQESMTIGQQWGMQKGQEVGLKLIEGLKKKGIKLSR